MLRNLVAAAIAAAVPLVASASGSLQSDAGRVVATDRESRTVALHNGSLYHLPNRVSLSDFRGRPLARIWFRVEDGKRVVVHHETIYFEIEE